MKYGCIGENLEHSFSKEIHSIISDYEYECLELAKDDVAAFMEAAEFEAINVTIPYKETVIPYLDELDEGAKLIGAVNTIVNRGGVLRGYNTDFYGMKMLIKRIGASLSGKKVLVLGSGGTGKTARAVALSEGAREVLTVSRKPKGGAISYADAEKKHRDASIIINTTPVGMYPRIFGKPISLKSFTSLEAVVDAVYNPINTPLVMEARSRGIAAEGGLYMLVAQAVRASELFTGHMYNASLTDAIFTSVKRDKTNIVLVGMPASGKSTIAKIISEKLCREHCDTDLLAEENAGKTVAEIFKDRGEDVFRDVESLVTDRASAKSGIVISTGGGTLQRKANAHALRENGRVYFIDRPLELLNPTENRPTAQTKEALARLYADRYPIYRKYSDVVIDGSGTPEEIAELIIKDFSEA